MKTLNRILGLGAIVFISFGCSRDYLLANIYMFKAEGFYQQAYQLKIKKVPYEDRLSRYREACSYFLKAYELAPRIFTLNRIQTAADSCWRVEDQEAREKFLAFEEQYVKKHPQEYEYGEAGIVNISDNL